MLPAAPLHEPVSTSRPPHRDTSSVTRLSHLWAYLSMDRLARNKMRGRDDPDLTPARARDVQMLPTRDRRPLRLPIR